MHDCILYAVLAVCAFTDVREHRIPNVLLAAGMAAGFLCAVHDAWEGGGGLRLALWAGAGFAGRMIPMIVLGFPFFLLRMAGSGDIKLMALISAFLGFGKGFAAIGAGFCLGAVLSLVRMLQMGSVRHRFMYLHAYIRRLLQSRKIEAYYCPGRDGYRCVIPLGACFFAGTLCMAFWKG